MRAHARLLRICILTCHYGLNNLPITMLLPPICTSSQMVVLLTLKPVHTSSPLATSTTTLQRAVDACTDESSFRPGDIYCLGTPGPAPDRPRSCPVPAVLRLSYIPSDRAERWRDASEQCIHLVHRSSCSLAAEAARSPPRIR